MKDIDSKNITPAPKRLKVLLNTITKLIVWFGVLSRIVLIPFFAISSYQLIDPQSVLDTPFAELTLGMIFESLFTWLFVIFCVIWFFQFPVLDSRKWLDFTDEAKTRALEDAYIKWARAGVVIAFFIWLIITEGG